MSPGARDHGSIRLVVEKYELLSAPGLAISRVIHLLGPGLIYGGRRLAIHDRLGYEP